MSSKREDLTGQIFGTIQCDSPAPNKATKTYWNCHCIICGKTSIIQTCAIKNKTIKSCGCGHYDPTAKEENVKLNNSKQRICAICGKSFIPKKFGANRKYCFDCSPSDIKDENNKIINNPSNDKSKIKQYLIDYKGGKCQICGYNKSNWALHFHHINPNEKDFTISEKHTTKLDSYIKEINKCILLCSNCHAEIHELIYKNPNFDINTLLNQV